jgi:hypothetical protein
MTKNFIIGAKRPFSRAGNPAGTTCGKLRETHMRQTAGNVRETLPPYPHRRVAGPFGPPACAQEPTHLRPCHNSARANVHGAVNIAAWLRVPDSHFPPEMQWTAISFPH